MAETTVRGMIGDVEVTMQAGKFAQLSDGAVMVTVGETQVLATATAARQVREGTDFFPLTVDVEERHYAVGRIPGSFFRREGRATENAILTCRLIDRPLRPSFPKGFRCSTHVVTTIMSADQVYGYPIPALNGASAALSVSPLPFNGPVGAIEVALIDGDWVPFPTFEQIDTAVFTLVVAGARNESGDIDIVMVEAGATEHGHRLVADGAQASDEATITKGIDEAKGYIDTLIGMQLELREAAEIRPVDWPIQSDYSDDQFSRVEAAAKPKLEGLGLIVDKHERQDAERSARDEVMAELGLDADDADKAEVGAAKAAFRSVQKNVMRARVISDSVRMDGRALDEIRPLSIDVGVLNEAHGSAMFQRGETQVLNVTTLGMMRMSAMLDTIDIQDTKRYMHHYNMPPFATGEAGFMRGPKRREIGHGALAEKALLPVIPPVEDFPYAYRLVSEVLMSNGSSSMASICGSSLSLMDAGVPIEAPVAGIAMGLIAHDGNFVTLTDILGAEDALGDMDFKVAGTREMITALQLDTKISSLPAEVLSNAMDQAKTARLFILDAMAEVMPTHREALAPKAPKIEAIEIPKDKIGEVIGPKGKTIRTLEEETGATIEIDDEGIVRVGASDTASMELARERILAIGFPPEAEVGAQYDGEVVNVTKFGAFINILPGRDGLLHISKMGGGRRIDQVEDVLALGDTVQVVVSEVDDRDKVSLELAEGVELEMKPGAKPSKEGGGGGGRDRGDRGGRDGGGRGRSSDRGGRDGGSRGGGRDRGSRDSGGRGRSSDRGNKSSSDSSSSGDGDSKRTVVSFEDEFDGGF